MDDPTVVRWAKHVINDMAPGMEGSAVVMSLVPGGEHSLGDVKFWVELGAAIMMDKPIIAVCFSDRECPERLRRVADEVVVLEEGVTPEASEQMAEAIRRVVERQG